MAAAIVAGHLATIASGDALLRGGKVHALAVASPQRLPTLQTFAEADIDDSVIEQWRALVTPATTPLPVAEMWSGRGLEFLQRDCR